MGDVEPGEETWAGSCDCFNNMLGCNVEWLTLLLVAKKYKTRIMKPRGSKCILHVKEVLYIKTFNTGMNGSGSLLHGKPAEVK